MRCRYCGTRDEWIPLFYIRILGYHGYLNIMDTWIVGYHGYLDSWIPWIVRYHENLVSNHRYPDTFGYFKNQQNLPKWGNIFLISQKNDSLSISIQISMDTWIYG